MPRTPNQFHYRDTPRETLDLFSCLARTPPDTPITTGWNSSAACHAFRNRIYRWRRTVLDILAHVDTPEAEELEAWLTTILSLTVHPKEFLDLTVFQIEDHPTDTTKRVVASVRQPMFIDPQRPAPTAPSRDAFAESLRLLQQAGLRPKEDL